MINNLKSAQNVAFFGFSIVYLVIIVLGILLLSLDITPNPWFGVRVPWTMHDQDIWKRTQLFSGKVMIIIGILGLLLNYLFKESNFFLIFALVLINSLFMAAISIGYSMKIYKQKYHTLEIRKR